MLLPSPEAGPESEVRVTRLQDTGAESDNKILTRYIVNRNTLKIILLLTNVRKCCTTKHKIFVCKKF